MSKEIFISNGVPTIEGTTDANKIIEVKRNRFGSDFVVKIKEIAGVTSGSLKYNKGPWEVANINKTNNYTAEEIKKTLNRGDIKELRDMSKYFFDTSGIYKRLLLYISNMLTWDNIVYIKKMNAEKLSDKTVQALTETCLFMEDLNLEGELTRMMLAILIEGAYYGIFKELDNGRYMFQDLQCDYCRTRYKTANNNMLLELSVRYFTETISLGIKTNPKFENQFMSTFPKEIRRAYNKYKAGDVSDLIDGEYLLIGENTGMAFYFYSAKPLFASTILAVKQLDEYKDLEKSLDKQELKKLMFQQIPFDKESGDLLLETDEAIEVHKAATEMLSGNDDIDVLTGFCDTKMLELVNNSKSDRDNLNKMERSVYNESGITKSLFAADTNLALEYSLNNDLSLAMSIVACTFIPFINMQVNNKFSKPKKYFFEVCILPITHYNREKMSKAYLQGAQFGFSKILAGVAFGTKQSNLLTQIELENDVYGLPEIMVPLQSSFTSSNSDITDRQGGAPVKSTDQKSDKTIQNNEVQ